LDIIRCARNRCRDELDTRWQEVCHGRIRNRDTSDICSV
jgi:hypothetical protein